MEGGKDNWGYNSSTETSTIGSIDEFPSNNGPIVSKGVINHSLFGAHEHETTLAGSGKFKTYTNKPLENGKNGKQTFRRTSKQIRFSKETIVYYKPKSYESSVDEGWAWVILATAFVNFFICSSIFTSGIYNVMFLEEYGESKSLTSWPAALASGIGGLAGPFGSICVNNFGPRITVCIGSLLCCLGNVLTFFTTSIYQIIFTFGIMQGLGLCFIHLSTTLTLGFYFKKYRNQAYSVALTGTGVGVIIFPNIIKYLFETYGMYGTLLITGSIQLHCLVTGCLMRPFIDKSKSNKMKMKRNSTLIATVMSESKSSSLASSNLSVSGGINQTRNNEDDCYGIPPNIVENLNKKNAFAKRFFKIFPREHLFSIVMISITLFMLAMTYSSVFVHYLAYVHSKGIKEKYLPLILSSMGVGSLSGRLIIGFLTSGSTTRTTIAFISSGCVTSLLCVIAPYITTEYIGQIVFSVMYTFFNSFHLTLLLPFAIDLFGTDKIVTISGLLSFMRGLGKIAGPPFAGFFIDITGSYYYLFTVTAVCGLSGALTNITIPIRNWYKSSKFEEHEQTKL